MAELMLTKPAYYNEINKYAAQWLRNLIQAGLIAPGDVDERSIEDVRPDDLRGYSQCHFFAGIGIWSLALRRAGWPDHRPVWTGSCPCQPFSAAGKGAGFADERHLWPAFFHLIEQRQPATVFGEQVASADGLAWFDLVQADLEGAAYAVGAADLCATGVGAPHIRQRLFWVADTLQPGRPEGRTFTRNRSTTGGGEFGGLADSVLQRRPERQSGIGTEHETYRRFESATEVAGLCVNLRPGPTNGFWRAADWLACRDGKWRPARPGSFPLVVGHPARVARLRAAGNAISPQVAEAFIRSYLDAQNA